MIDIILTLSFPPALYLIKRESQYFSWWMVFFLN